MIAFSEAQALALITDPGTLKRGQELAKPAKWARLGRTDAAAWGECAGSGAKPYLTGIDLSEPAFKCSCPSRVFPCKHGAALLLLLARQPATFPENAPPAWLAEWLDKRQQTQTKKVEIAAAPKAATQTADAAEPGSTKDEPAAEVEVDARRLARMSAGAEDLAAWLEDLVRAGLATLDQQPGKFWEGQAARLVDNQLPGLAATVRELATLRHAHADWPARLLGRLGELYLLVRAFRNLPNLSPEARQEILQLVGVNLKKEALLASAAPLADEWQVLGQFRWEEDRLTARRTWLHGRRSGRTALVLEFAFGSQPFATALVPQARYRGELVFYPGLLPLRAAPVSFVYEGSTPPEMALPGQTISQLLTDYADALARQPWLREWPATLAQVLPVPQADGSWHLHHATEAGTLALRFTTEEAGWQLLAQSGGQPLTLFGEWDGRAFRPLSSWRWSAENKGANSDALLDSSALPDELPGAGPGEGQLPSSAQLLRVALLGTRQSGEQLVSVPTGATLADGPEQRLLLAAGTRALMQKAGFRAPATATLPPTPAPPETWEPLGPVGTELLAQFLAGQQPYYYRHFHRLERAQRRIPHHQLVDLLNYSLKNRYEFIAQHAAVLGTYGQWLAAQNPDWKFVAETANSEASETPWETGTPTMRRFYLQEVYAADPARAIELLAEALPQEPASTQVTLLAALHGHDFERRLPLPAAFGPVLEPLLKSRARDVRQSAAQLLAQTTDNALVPRLWARAEPLIELKNKHLGRKHLEITLPDTWTTAWQHDGIEQRTADYQGGEKAGWLGQLMALIPPQRWAEQWQLSPAQAVALVAASEWSNVLLPAWLRAARLYADAGFARALLDHEAQHPTQPANLVVSAGRILPENEKLAWLLALLPEDPTTMLKPPHWVEWLLIPNVYDYPLVLLHRVLPLLAALLSQPWQPNWAAQEKAALQLLASLCEDVDESLLPLFEKYLSPVGEAQPRLASEIAAIFAAFRNRQQFTASLTEPATPFLA